MKNIVNPCKSIDFCRKKVDDAQNLLDKKVQKCKHEIWVATKDDMPGKRCLICGEELSLGEEGELGIQAGNIPFDTMRDAVIQLFVDYANYITEENLLQTFYRFEAWKTDPYTRSEYISTELGIILESIIKKVFIVCSKAAYGNVKEIADRLKGKGYLVIYPNCYEDPSQEEKAAQQGNDAHSEFKLEQYKKSDQKIGMCDAVLVLNYPKEVKASSGNMDFEHYIGGATLLEIYEAYRLGKTIFVLNEIDGPFCSDEVKGFNPTVLYGDIDKMKL